VLVIRIGADFFRFLATDRDTDVEFFPTLVSVWSPTVVASTQLSFLGSGYDSLWWLGFGSWLGVLLVNLGLESSHSDIEIIYEIECQLEVLCSHLGEGALFTLIRIRHWQVYEKRIGAEGFV